MTIKRVLLAVLLAAGLVLGTSPARAAVTDSTADNVQDGDNSSDTTLGGASASGDAVGGQVTGLVSSGDTSVDAKNKSEDVDVESGEAHGTNDAASITGLAKSDNDDIVVSTDVDGLGDLGQANVQDGDNDLSLTQTANASSGDAVGGQVIGSVTSAGGSADIVADNSSNDVDVNTGDAEALNDESSYVGLANVDESIEIGPGVSDISGIDDASDSNLQDGDNSADISQSSTAASGDGVGGQVIGAVSAGDTSIDAKNSSEDVDVETGFAAATDTVAADVGVSFLEEDTMTIQASDISEVTSDDNLNAQDGDNDLSVDQTSNAASGDGVAGQVIGTVTSAGGSADVVADNSSEDVDINTGEATVENEFNSVVGLVLNNGDGVDVGDIDSITSTDDAFNLQDGDNSQDATQSASASSGDGVGGQVIGLVSAGDASVDAKNSSKDVDLDTGHADSFNNSEALVGLVHSEDASVLIGDVTNVDGDDEANIQDGDNDQSLDQTADATTGDAVGGQVIGAVTSAGGSADVVADNASEDVDISTGEADADNNDEALVGLALTSNSDGDIEVDDVSDVTIDGESNVQDGGNSQDVTETATASSGDGVGGQVIGAVSAGDTSIDAKNRSEDVDVETGNATADNDNFAVVGLANSEDDIFVSDVEDTTLNDDSNVQDGDNDESVDQTADASTGDGVAGQVIGAVTSAGGSADIVADNSSNDVDIESGSADAVNDSSAFVGLAKADSDVEVEDLSEIDTSGPANLQDGDNSLDVSQDASASSGDGVGGQVLGIVSAGDASVDAKNSSEDIDLESGPATADNDARSLVGLGLADDGDVVVQDISGSNGTNLKDGDNDGTVDQTADAFSGDAVGGQVAGAVVSAGGSADAVLDNASEDVDATSSSGDFNNDLDLFVGQAFASSELIVG